MVSIAVFKILSTIFVTFQKLEKMKFRFKYKKNKLRRIWLHERKKDHAWFEPGTPPFRV